jgi:hypothetical protein
MTIFNGRRGPNVSQYLRNLNVQDSVMEDNLLSDEDLQKGLDMFTNSQFFDFDSGQNTDYQAQPPKPESVVDTPGVLAVPEDLASADTFMPDLSNLEFLGG